MVLMKMGNQGKTLTDLKDAFVKMQRYDCIDEVDKYLDTWTDMSWWSRYARCNGEYISKVSLKWLFVWNMQIAVNHIYYNVMQLIQAKNMKAGK